MQNKQEQEKSTIEPQPSLPLPPPYSLEAVEPVDITEDIELDPELVQAHDDLLDKWKNIQEGLLLPKQQNTYTYDPQNPITKSFIKPVSEEKNDIFEKYTPEIWSYLKAKFLFEEIILPLHENKLLSYYELQDSEFMYLISFRAWCEIRFARKPFPFDQRNSSSRVSKSNLMRSMSSRKLAASLHQKQKPKIEFQFDDSDKNLKYLVDPIYKLSNKIDECFEFSHKILTKSENVMKNKLKNLSHWLFYYSYKATRDKFLCGFENVDFDKYQQIQYTNENYIPAMIEKLIKKNESRLVPKLACYKSIMMIELQRIRSFDDFQILKQTLLEEWKQKNINNLNPEQK